MSKLPDYFPLPVHPSSPLQFIFTAASEDALDLLHKMLTFDPLKRISAREVLCILYLSSTTNYPKQALMHSYFKEAPRPTLPSKLPQTNPEEWAAYKAEADRRRMRDTVRPKKLDYS